jgi:hypothetical protein
MNREYTFQILVIFAVLMIINPARAGNIDPYNNGSKYAYGENVGWFNFEPNLPDANVGATVTDANLTGFIWAENIGWINLSPHYGGVLNDGHGNLSGYAWGENVGWINFDPQFSGTHYGVKIDAAGSFSGYGWGENIGWINFNNTDLFSKGVKVCVVEYMSLRNFADQWLMDGRGLAADLNNSTHVDFIDFSIFALHWFDYCPDNWSL